MVVITLTPRSFVTESFDTLYIPFTSYLYKHFSELESNWWKKYFQSTKNIVFKGQSRKVDLSGKGSLTVIREKYDELALFTLINSTPAVFTFPNNSKLVKLSIKLYNIRNEWAHRDWDFDFKWADDALDLMIEMATEIDSSETVDKIMDLQKKLRINENCRNREIVCSAKDLKVLLEERIFAPNEKILENDSLEISEYEKKDLLRKIKHCREILEDERTAEGVITFFWNAIISRSDSYTATRKIGKTFEDTRNEFERMCYNRK